MRLSFFKRRERKFASAEEADSEAVDPSAEILTEQEGEPVSSEALDEALIALVKPHFDPEHYAKSDPAQSETAIDDLLAHYLTEGWKDGRSPNRDFDPEFYLANYADVRAADGNPFLHYLNDGIAEGRIPRGPTATERALVARIVDPAFYRYRYRDLDAAIDPVLHFATFGWRERRDPNPFTLMRYVARNDNIADMTLTELANHLNGQIFHNPLLRRPASLAEIRAALGQGEDALAELFQFDVHAYSTAQHDVLGQSPHHPVAHLFHDGLFQNRLRNGQHLHRLLVPVDSYVNDYELLIAQDGPFAATGFTGLRLDRPKREVAADLSSVALAIGVVLFRNPREEVERLVRSVQSNAAQRPFRTTLCIFDNSPERSDLDWIAGLCPDVGLHIEQHPDNPGFAIGHNGLMEHGFATGATHYLGLNPDGYLLPNAVEQVLKFAVAKEHPALIEMDCEPVSHPKWYHPVTGETEWVSGAAFLLDAEAYGRTGGFDPAFPMYCEDTDLSFRARMAGVRLYVSPRGRYYHDTSGRLHTPENWRAGRMMVGTWYLCMKWGNVQRARLIRSEMLRRGFDIVDLPSPPETVPDIPGQIADLMRQERFAHSRFWNH
ncbi:hypothetical protein EU803_17425 [Loktanella sp. IMCC34160]|uniref:hypothetical protein n=1 Tax=Loktanella sp. IMCC34160 TaxID=2510646 RepID=UPI00101D5604|nr:hypothetical protein [Loktanella sp. IMCC34160]RYG89511.1 hypothetical protein EU803_17425 [Loktanella sp. IMCC34160]